MKETQFRQGDVLIERVRSNVRSKPHKVVPRDNGRVILAYGEVTGHAHAIADAGVEQFELETGERFIVTERGVSLSHEEHATIQIPGGTYRVTRQREYSPEEIRNVAD
ncbi:MAG TPA: hypothetical protein VJS44_04785 [Pyrinomonadaceae bacterium]|nr:hypothetical protein [Pyrinomonadaceae bacterium]